MGKCKDNIARFKLVFQKVNGCVYPIKISATIFHRVTWNFMQILTV